MRCEVEHDLGTHMSFSPAWLAWRRSPWAPTVVLVASALLTTELLVQIPFLGFSVLQMIFGTVAIGMAVVAFLARRAGWRPRGRLTASMQV